MAVAQGQDPFSVGHDLPHHGGFPGLALGVKGQVVQTPDVQAEAQAGEAESGGQGAHGPEFSVRQIGRRVGWCWQQGNQSQAMLFIRPPAVAGDQMLQAGRCGWRQALPVLLAHEQIQL